MDLVTAGEVDVADFVDHVAQQVAVDHAVDGPFEHRGDHIAPVAAIGALQAAQIGEKSRPFLSIRPDSFLVIHEADQLITSDTVLFRRPVAPAIGRLQRRPKTFVGHPRFLLGDLLHVIEEFEKHDPGEHRQPVEIAVEPFVLAHDVAAGFYDREKPLGGGERLGVFLYACHELCFLFEKLFRRL